jgi:hypothetical protein
MAITLDGTNGLTLPGPGTGVQLGSLTSGTAITSMSGSSADFTGIPSWVKRITVTASNITFAAAVAGARLRIGSGSLVTSGYTFSSMAGSSYATFSDGIATYGTNSTTIASSMMTLVLVGENTWVCTGIITRPGDSIVQVMGGYITLSGTLDRISLVATTSTFTAGSVNILYE